MNYAVTFVCLLAFAVSAAGEQFPVNDFPTLLDEVANVYDPADPTDEMARVRAELKLDSDKELTQMEGVVTLWKARDRRSAELAWWRSGSRGTRMLVMALYHTKFTDPDLDFFPQFARDASRFAPEEREERRQEVAFIEKNLPAIRPKIQMILDQPSLTVEWIEPPQELAQGKITVRVRLTANTDFRFPHWLADGQGPNFSVWIDRFPATGKPTALLPVVQRGIVSHEPLTLYRGTSRELSGEFALNNDPGEYELFVGLGNLPETRCKASRVRVIRGTVVDVQK